METIFLAFFRKICVSSSLGVIPLSSIDGDNLPSLFRKIFFLNPVAVMALFNINVGVLTDFLF